MTIPIDITKWGEPIPGKVTNVHDGDTFYITFHHPHMLPHTLVKHRIRVTNIDTPEVSAQLWSVERALAEIAKKRVQDLLDRKYVFFTADGVDQYGRLLCTIFLTNNNDQIVSLNDMLVQESLAVEYDGGHKHDVDWLSMLRLHQEYVASHQEASVQCDRANNVLNLMSMLN